MEIARLLWLTGQFSRYSALWLGFRDVDKRSLGGIRKKGDI